MLPPYVFKFLAIRTSIPYALPLSTMMVSAIRLLVSELDARMRRQALFLCASSTAFMLPITQVLIVNTLYFGDEGLAKLYMWLILSFKSIGSKIL